MRLKRWESPRRKGRNDKGKGGSARQRQLKKQTQMLRKRLKGDKGKGDTSPFPFCFRGQVRVLLPHDKSYEPKVQNEHG